MNRPLIVALVGAVVVLIALLLTFTVGREEDEALDAPPPGTQAPAAESSATSEALPETAGQPAAPAAKPSFDVVRIDREGNTVMAGRAVPKAEVIITDGDEELGRVRADDRGEWVFLPDKPLPAGTRALNLRSIAPDTGAEASAEGSVVLVVPEGQGSDQPVLAVQTAPGEPSRVLQAPAPALAESQPGGIPDDGAAVQTVIDVVDYDTDGNMSFGGQAEPGAVVQGYVDNVFAGRATADSSGRWSITPEHPVAPGQHALRADALSPKGDVLARAEIPFQRPESIDIPADERAVIVQPGNSLWRIARRTLGTGMDYTLIYEANRTQIRNPDLIYPGQIFILPREE